LLEQPRVPKADIHNKAQEFISNIILNIINTIIPNTVKYINESEMNDNEFRNKIFEFVAEELNANDPIELDGNPIKIINIYDDIGNFPRETDSFLELKDEPSPKIEQKSANLEVKKSTNNPLKK
jgi:hypothetical protein